ncbi:MAG: hypothetical protein PSV36_18925 [Algoriphagus sp.]|nr:hypothetical protein [Algoriphagus sp.]
MIHPKLEKLLSTEIDFDIKSSFAKAWELYKSQALLHLTFMILLFSIQGLFVIYLADYIALYSLLLAPPLYTRFFLVANKSSHGQSVRYMDFFGGFGYWFLMLSIWLIAQILIVIGLFALVIPGIYLAVSYMFSALFGIFGGFDFWTSLEYSRKLVTRNWWKFFQFFLILVLMNLIGAVFVLINPVAAILFIVAICISLPMTFLVIYVVFEELTRDALSTDEKESDATHE